jgi:hypothetical protein
MEEGMRKSMEEEGERRVRIAIAREMKKEDISAKQIAKYTKLSMEEIEKL